jgi:hypothetical protein
VRVVIATTAFLCQLLPCSPLVVVCLFFRGCAYRVSKKYALLHRLGWCNVASSGTRDGRWQSTCICICTCASCLLEVEYLHLCLQRTAGRPQSISRPGSIELDRRLGGAVG